MKVQVEEVSPVEKRLSIEVEPAFVERQLAEAYATLARQVKVPGFRPGKVPRRLLEKQYRAEVEADVIRRVQLLAFYDAIQAEKVEAVGEPHFSAGKLEAQQAFTFTARVEVKPKVTPKDYRGLALTRQDSTVGDDKVTEQLERLRTSRTKLLPVADRDVVARGDAVKADFEGTVDGQPFPGSSGKDATFEVQDGSFTEGRLPGLEGAKVGEAKELDVGFPADFHLEEMRGKVAHLVVTPKAIQTKETPALDDTLAASFGLKSLEELKARIRADLERARRREVETQEREEILTKLAEKNEVTLPGALVQRGVDMMLESALGSMARSGMDLRSLNLDWARLRTELSPRAEAEVRGQLLLEAIAQAESIEVTDEDVERRIGTLAEEAGVPAATVRKQYAQEEARLNLRVRLRDEKVLDYLKTNATYP